MGTEIPAIRKAGATWTSLSHEAQRGVNLHGHAGSVRRAAEGQCGGSSPPAEQDGSIRKQLSPRGATVPGRSSWLGRGTSWPKGAVDSASS